MSLFYVFIQNMHNPAQFKAIRVWMLRNRFLQCRYDNQALDEVQARTKTKQSCGELRVLCSGKTASNLVFLACW